MVAVVGFLWLGEDGRRRRELKLRARLAMAARTLEGEGVVVAKGKRQTGIGFGRGERSPLKDVAGRGRSTRVWPYTGSHAARGVPDRVAALSDGSHCHRLREKRP